MASAAKKKEQDQRAQIDAKNKVSVMGLYDKKLKNVKAARTLSADPCWLGGFKNRSKRRDDSLKSLKNFLEINGHELQTKDDLKEFNGHVKNLKEAIDDVNEHTRDLKAVVEELQEFVKSYDDAPLFFNEITENADFDLKTGAVKILKIKR